MGKKKKKKMDNMTKLLIPLAVAINMLAYNVLYSTTMVILGDSIGTILVGAICGPGPGAVVGILSNLVNVVKNPVMIVMLPLNVAFGVVSEEDILTSLESGFMYADLRVYRRMAQRKHYFSCHGR